MLKKLEAGTLIEVIIAMVIIMVIFGIALKIFNNVLYGGVSYQKVQVQNQLNVLAMQVKEKGAVAKEIVEIDNVSYQFFTDTSAVPGLMKLDIKAMQKQKLLGKLSCLFKVKTDETKN